MHRSAHYRIRVAGRVEVQWSDWFDGLAIYYTEEGDSILSGAVIDQAALFGFLTKLYDLGLPLLKLERLNHESRTEATAADEPFS